LTSIFANCLVFNGLLGFIKVGEHTAEGWLVTGDWPSKRVCTVFQRTLRHVPSGVAGSAWWLCSSTNPRLAPESARIRRGIQIASSQCSTYSSQSFVIFVARAPKLFNLMLPKELECEDLKLSAKSPLHFPHTNFLVRVPQVAIPRVSASSSGKLPVYICSAKAFERNHIMELDDFSLKASDPACPIDHLQSSSSQRQQSSIPDSRQDCNARCNSNSTVEGVVPKGSMQAERPTSFRPQPAAPTQTYHPTNRSKIQSVKHWWLHNIVIKLSYNLAGSSTKDDPRDHHALERTFLAYIRTSNAFVSLGVVIVQLFILADTNRTTGIVLAVFVFAIAIVVATLACARFFYQQKLLLRGRTTAGGWDVIVIWASTTGLCLGLFVAVLVSS
jgi:uncharacterized membrane protein YidH (DUF202 family)